MPEVKPHQVLIKGKDILHLAFLRLLADIPTIPSYILWCVVLLVRRSVVWLNIRIGLCGSDLYFHNADNNIAPYPVSISALSEPQNPLAYLTPSVHTRP